MLNAQMCNCIVNWENPPRDVDGTIMGQIIISSTPRGTGGEQGGRRSRPCTLVCLAVPHLRVSPWLGSPYLVYTVHACSVSCPTIDYPVVAIVVVVVVIVVVVVVACHPPASFPARPRVCVVPHARHAIA